MRAAASTCRRVRGAPSRLASRRSSATAFHTSGDHSVRCMSAMKTAVPAPAEPIPPVFSSFEGDDEVDDMWLRDEGCNELEMMDSSVARLYHPAAFTAGRETAPVAGSLNLDSGGRWVSPPFTELDASSEPWKNCETDAASSAGGATDATVAVVEEYHENICTAGNNPAAPSTPSTEAGHRNPGEIRFLDVEEPSPYRRHEEYHANRKLFNSASSSSTSSAVYNPQHELQQFSTKEDSLTARLMLLKAQREERQHQAPAAYCGSGPERQRPPDYKKRMKGGNWFDPLKKPGVRVRVLDVDRLSHADLHSFFLYTLVKHVPAEKCVKIAHRLALFREKFSQQSYEALLRHCSEDYFGAVHNAELTALFARCHATISVPQLLDYVRKYGQFSKGFLAKVIDRQLREPRAFDFVRYENLPNARPPVHPLIAKPYCLSSFLYLMGKSVLKDSMMEQLRLSASSSSASLSGGRVEGSSGGLQLSDFEQNCLDARMAEGVLGGVGFSFLPQMRSRLPSAPRMLQLQHGWRGVRRPDAALQEVYRSGQHLPEGPARQNAASMEKAIATALGTTPTSTDSQAKEKSAFPLQFTPVDAAYSRSEAPHSTALAVLGPGEGKTSAEEGTTGQLRGTIGPVITEEGGPAERFWNERNRFKFLVKNKLYFLDRRTGAWRRKEIARYGPVRRHRSHAVLSGLKYAKKMKKRIAGLEFRKEMKGISRRE